MIKIRIENDIPIEWEFFYADGVTPYSLEGRSLQLELRRFGRVIPIRDFSVQGNKLTFVFWGHAQRACGLGVYSVTLAENRGAEGMVTLDKVQPFELVPLSESVSDGSIVNGASSVMTLNPLQLASSLGDAVLSPASIADDLTTDDAYRVLSARQGVVLKGLVDGIIAVQSEEPAGGEKIWVKPGEYNRVLVVEVNDGMVMQSFELAENEIQTLLSGGSATRYGFFGLDRTKLTMFTFVGDLSSLSCSTVYGGVEVISQTLTREQVSPSEVYVLVDGVYVKDYYQKPSEGIPATDMTDDVQYALSRAKSALQTHQNISGKLDKSSVVSYEGDSDSLVMSQKAVTDALAVKQKEIEALAVAHSPAIISGYWHTWSFAAGGYINTGLEAQGPQGLSGDINYPTFDIDDNMHLIASALTEGSVSRFDIQGGHLKLTI